MFTLQSMGVIDEIDHGRSDGPGQGQQGKVVPADYTRQQEILGTSPVNR